MVLGVGSARGTTISLVTSKDNTLYQSTDGNISNGAGPHFFAGMTSGGTIHRGLLEFDLSLIPSGATINSASLTLNMSKSLSGSGTITLQRVLADWGEGTSNSGDPGGGGAFATPGDATWLNTFYNTGTWATPGGDFASTVTATAGIVGGLNIVSSTPQLLADLQGWMTSPSTNFGWIVRGDETSFGSSLRFDTRESTLPGTQPMLVIDYSLAPSNPTWNRDADASWSNSANWLGGVPNASNVRATFGSAITAPRTITLSSEQIVGTVSFNSAQRYTLSGPGTLNLTSSGRSLVEVLSGSHTIAAPVNFSNSATLSVESSSTLTMSGEMSSNASVNLTKTGPGTLEVRQARASSLTIAQGRVRVLPDGSSAALSRLDTLNISSPAALDLENNDLVLDQGDASGVRSMLIDGRIRSSQADATHRLGYADNAVLGVASFDGEPVGPASILVKYTFAGDGNLDGVVDINDLYLLASHFNRSGTAWTGGDFNYDGVTNARDLGLLANNWQAGVAAPLGLSLRNSLELLGLPVTILPEPSTATLVLGPLLLLRRSQRAGKSPCAGAGTRSSRSLRLRC
jgi:hypothetical protein